MPSPSDRGIPRCPLCSMNCPMGAQDDGLGHIGTVFPSDLGVEQGACVRGLTAARLLNGAERIFAGRKGDEAKSADEVLQSLLTAASRVAPGAVAMLVDLSRPLEGALAAAAICQAGGARFAAVVPPEDMAFAKAGLTRCPPFAEIAACNVVLAIGDPFSTHPAVAALVRNMQFGARGNKLISLDTAWGRTSAGADQAVAVGPMKMAAFVAALAVECGAGEVAKCLGGTGVEEICAAAGIPVGRVKGLAAQLREAKSLGIILSHPLGRYADGAAAAAAVGRMAQALKAKVWPLLVSANSGALPHLKQRFGAADLTDVIRDAEAGRLKALVVVGADLSSVLPEKLWRVLVEKCDHVYWAGSLDSAFAAEAELVAPLALPWEEEGTLLSAGGEPTRFVPWMAKPATTLTARELASRLFAYAGGGSLLAMDAAELMRTKVAEPALADLIGPSVLKGAEPAKGQAVVVGAPEPQGYTGGLSLADVSWQRRLAGEEKGRLSAELAAELGLSEPGIVSLRNGTETAVLCAAAVGGEGRVVALPSHWQSLRDLLRWRAEDGAIEPAPALVAIGRA